LSFQEYPEPSIDSSQVRVETLYSGISHGTEMNVYRGTAPFFVKRWDPRRRIFLRGKVSWEYPMSYGYEQVCRVVETGRDIDEVKIGDILCASYGHQTSAVLTGREIKSSKSALEAHFIPPDIEPIFGVFRVLSSVALNGVHNSGVRLGDNIAIFGLGVLGLLVVQFARLSGAKTIIGVDFLEKRLRLAERLGADLVLNPQRISDIGGEINKATNGGVDIAFEASGSYKALHEAVRSCARRTKVIALGWYQNRGNDLLLGEEFHHNEIRIIPNLALPKDGEQRWCWSRIVETFFDLIRKGRIGVKELITHALPFDEAPEVFNLINEHPEEVVKCILTFENYTKP